MVLKTLCNNFNCASCGFVDSSKCEISLINTSYIYKRSFNFIYFKGIYRTWLYQNANRYIISTVELSVMIKVSRTLSWTRPFVIKAFIIAYNKHTTLLLKGTYTDFIRVYQGILTYLILLMHIIWTLANEINLTLEMIRNWFYITIPTSTTKKKSYNQNQSR